MVNEETWGIVIQSVTSLFGFFLVWKLVRNMKFSLSFRGWGSLRDQYGFSLANLPSGLRMRQDSIRVGIYKTDMAELGLDEHFLYLRRPFGAGVNGMLRIPFHAIVLEEAPRTTGGLLNLPVAGIFRVDGVDVWIGSPLADKIMERLH